MAVATVTITSPVEAWAIATQIGALASSAATATGSGLPLVFGQYACDASPSATTVPLGFRPRMIIAVQSTDGTGFWIWSTTFADDTALKNVAGTQTLLASGGITPSDTGFVVGAGAGVQTASKVFEFVAFR